MTNPLAQLLRVDRPRPRLMTVAEVAEYLRLSADFVRDHAQGRRHPKLPGYKIGLGKKRPWRFKKEEVDVWYDQVLRRA